MGDTKGTIFQQNDNGMDQPQSQKLGQHDVDYNTRSSTQGNGIKYNEPLHLEPAPN